jgi:copper(I)-binding protein
MTIDIRQPWARIGQTYVDSAIEPAVAGYMSLANTGNEPDRLLAATSPAAEKIEIYGIKVVGPNVQMRLLEKGLGLPGDTTITLRPRGYHLMMRGVRAPLAKGQSVQVTLTFEKAGSRQIELIVEGEGPIGYETLMEK